MRWGGVFLCVVGLAGSGPFAAAEEAAEKPRLIEEFLTAEPTYVESRGEIQVGAALDYRRPAGDWRVPVLVEYGLTNRIEAELEWSYLSVPGEGSRHRGLGDLELGLHYALRPDVAKVAVTLGADVGLPTGDEAKGLGSGESDVEFLGIAGVRLGRAELHVTGMLELEDEAEPALNAAAVYPQGDFRFTLEANVLRGGAKARLVEQDPLGEPGEVTQDEDAWVVVTPGLFHRPSPEVEYGIGVPLGLTRSAPDWGVVGRLTVEFEF
jgi:hypothetical protein